jgi:hypothetical protein
MSKLNPFNLVVTEIGTHSIRTFLQLVPRSRIRGSIHPLLHTYSWRSAYLVKHRDNLTFTLPFSYNWCNLFLYFLRLFDDTAEETEEGRSDERLEKTA